MTLTDAFAKFGVTVTQPRGTLSAWNDKGELVICLLQDFAQKVGIERLGWITRKGRAPYYVDRFSEWEEKQNLGAFKANVEKAYHDVATIRCVIGIPRDRNDLSLGMGDFDYKPDWVGCVTEFDGDRVVFDFS